jgi:1-deoxy-D-xylulose-5-phosphate reductoisomerase
MRGVAILGATGSIGASTLDVIRRHPGRFRVVSLSANTDVDALATLCIEFTPQRVAIADPGRVDRLAIALRGAGLETEILSGPLGLQALASDPAADTVVAAIVGAAGLGSTLAEARSGKRILLANKEAVVLAGALLLPAVASGGGELLPIDSEHNAIFQCLPRGYHGNPDHHGVERVLLTASGGPLLRMSSGELDAVTPEVACAHPNWRMGRKISVDSATLMNKGLEVIEARWLFGVPASRIEVVVHPQSIIHSLVAYRDGSVLAQLGQPDMRTAIAYGLGWPERIDAGVAALDLAALGKLDFEPPDRARFPALDLAYAALAAGGTAPGILNAANEVAVDAFLNGRIRFPAIARLVETTLATLPSEPVRDLDQLLAVDGAARETAHRLIPECA